MPTIEGRLIYNWRIFRDLTQESLGERAVPTITKNGIHNWERGPSSMSVKNLLRIVRALGVPGSDDARRLSRFFLGPDETMIEEAIEAHRQTEEKSRGARLMLEGLSGRVRRP